MLREPVIQVAAIALGTGKDVRYRSRLDFNGVIYRRRPFLEFASKHPISNPDNILPGGYAVFPADLGRYCFGAWGCEKNLRQSPVSKGA